MKISLRDRIRQAPDANAVMALANEGSQYKQVSPNTRRKWDKAAKARLKELGA